MDRLQRWVLSAALAGIAAGAVAALAGSTAGARAAWAATTAVALVPLAASVARDLWHRETGVDAIALLAMAGALAVGEYLAGAVVAVMLSGGQVLEKRAAARARRELSALVERAPRTVTREEDGALRGRPVAEVVPGDILLVRHGEVVAVDGVLHGGAATIDESALTGEALPVDCVDGDRVRSGTSNAGSPFRMRALATAAASTYAGIVRLVKEAEASKAPFVRMADRYALFFLPLTVIISTAAWLVSGDPVRAVAVLVVATPCPLILAAPVAIAAGISRAARRGIVVKGGAALEAVAQASVVLFDKTGTLTAGMPRVVGVEVFGELEPNEVLRLAASVDQASVHVLADAIVAGARERGLTLSFPDEVEESPGTGVRGLVDGHAVAVGRTGWVTDAPLPDRARRLRQRTTKEGASNVFVAVDGHLAGAIVLSDPIRPDAAATMRALRRLGVRRLAMVTGDAADVAEGVAAVIGLDEVYAERSPEDKVEVARMLSEHGTTLMVGDGINDAPALAAAGAGIAMGARGATAASETADVVVMVDQLDRVVEARRVALRSRGIAVQSVVAGMTLSVVAMGFAAWGLLVPVAGALVQEAIDVAVILNSLRALRDERRSAPAAAEPQPGTPKPADLSLVSGA
jgi:heavy metal translocating P-type ATPase